MAETPLVRSLLRGLDILELAADSSDGVSLGEMAEHVGVTRPTAFNLARTLMARGYLVKTPRPIRYRPGRSLGELLARRRRGALHASLRLAIRELATSFRQVWVFAAEASAGEALITLRLDPSRPEVVEEPLHRVSPPYNTAAALGLYAFGSDDEREATETQYPFDENGVSRWGSRARFASFLAECRRRGSVLLTEPQYRLVLPIRDREGGLQAVLGLSFGNERQPSGDEKRLASERLEAAVDRVEKISTEGLI